MDDLLAQAEGELTRNPRLALELAKTAWQNLAAAGTPDQLLACRICLGWSHHYLSLAGEAAVHFNDALDAAVRQNSVVYEIQARLGLGAVFRQLGRFDTALDHLSQAWRLAEASGDELGELKASITIAEVHLALERPQDALEGLSRARDKIKDTDRRAGLVDILLSLGQTFLSLKRSTEALEQLSRALVMSKDEGNRIGEARALTLIGLVYRDQGELEIAEEYHLECLKICQAVDHRWGQLDAYLSLGDLHALRGFREVARKYFSKVVDLARALDAQSYLVRADLKMAALWETEGNLAQALAATREALDLERRIKADEASRNVRSLLDQFQAEQSRNQAELLRLKSNRLEEESQELKKALDSLRVISELGRRITSSLTVAGLFQTLYDSLSQLFDLPAFGLALYDPLDGTMRYPFRIETGVRGIPGPRKPMGLTLAGWALRHKTTILLQDLHLEGGRYLDNATFEEFKRDSQFRAAVFLPLYAGEDPIGALTIQHPRPGAFTTVHSGFLETLSGYVVVALTNALSHRKVRRLNKQILRLAHYDPLTGLANRRLLSDYLKRTVALSARRNRRFALFFLDLDGFKPVNDTLGHAAGDFVLSRLGKRLSAALRDSDLVARVGGDEFVALALEVEDRPSIEAIAEKLAKAITEPLVWEGKTLSLGVSIGIAVYPESATDADSLLNRADAAMYKIKHGGKNSWGFA